MASSLGVEPRSSDLDREWRPRGFGVSLALAAFVGIIASFWVWIAAVTGVWWERKAEPAAVAAMEELSDLSPS